LAARRRSAAEKTDAVRQRERIHFRRVMVFLFCHRAGGITAADEVDLPGDEGAVAAPGDSSHGGMGARQSR
jgi:hypothetical protein